ncbi:unnamed protein product [Schistosoma curassoni]|uniref:PUA domain-containing protein n=1 Tax=Schistosoma curassoni TaxID=6186 RepID=A0A183KY29_9TREM|nr:unnamed protein product [Schistosoma curassoni]
MMLQSSVAPALEGRCFATGVVMSAALNPDETIKVAPHDVVDDEYIDAGMIASEMKHAEKKQISESPKVFN